jgi:hypothetical protein
MRPRAAVLGGLPINGSGKVMEGLGDEHRKAGTDLQRA